MFLFFFPSTVWRKRAVLIWPTAGYTPPSLFPSPLEKLAVIGVVSTSGGCCTSSRMSKLPFKPPSPTATGSPLRSGTKLEVWTGEQRSSLFSTPGDGCYCFPLLYLESSHSGPLCKSLLSLSGFLTSLQFCCLTAPSTSAKCSHITPPPNPASPPAVALWLTHGTMPTIQLMYLIDSWNPLMPKASSHGYGTIKYICAYSWMKVRFQQDFLREMWKLCVFGGWLTVRCCWRLRQACSRPDIHLEKFSFPGFG